MLDKLLIRESYSNKSFEKYIGYSTIERSKIFVLLIIILEFIMIILTYTKFDLFDISKLSFYRAHYIFFFSCATIYYIGARIYSYKNLEYKTSYKFILAFLGFLILLWSISISLIDLSLGGGISIYLTFLFILSVIVIVRPDIKAVQYTAAHIFFITNFPQATHSMGFILNSTIFVLFAWFVSRQQYALAYNRYKNNLLIIEKNEMLKKQNEKLIHLTITDHLTNIYNRYSLEDILSVKYSKSYVNKTLLSVLMIDIDYFKKINDTCGHIQGDKYLIDVANILKEISLAHNGAAFRYGGDEFCLIFSDPSYSNPDCIDNIIKLIHKKISTLNNTVEKSKIPLTLSIGVYSAIPKTVDQEWEYIELADQDLYKNKAKRNRRINDVN
ncbi:MAG: GGDEF domain-containing protein [Bacillota bacterium]|nr:GGDEF domain-containing protein [Bacillota bacterium]